MKKHPDTRSWRSPEGVDFTATLLLVDELGHGWYHFDEPLRMPAGRCLAGELAVEWANLNITPEDLDAYIAKMEEDGNSGQIVSMFHTLAVLKERRKWQCERKTLQSVACVYFMVDDEPLGECSDHYDRIKLDLWARSRDLAAFFLTQAFVLTRGFTPFSGTGILDYFSATELMAMRRPKGKPASSEPATGSKGPRASFMDGVKTLTRKPPSPAGKSRPK